MLRFTRADIHDIPPTLLDTILTKTGEVGSPEIVAENGHLIKCTSYLCLALSCEFANDVFAFKAHASYCYADTERMQQRLVSTRGAVSESPSNSILDQFTLKNISALKTYVS